MTQPIPLYLVDDDEAIRDSLPYLLESYGLTATAFASGQLFLEQVDLDQPGVVILDHRMPDLTGPELHQLLVQRYSPLQAIYLTGHGDLDMAVAAFRDGAIDFFQKPVDGSALAAAITKAWQQSQQQRHQLAGKRRLAGLTPRERDIFWLVQQDLTNKQMADTLFVSVRTIEVHRAKMMKKLGFDNVAELARFGAQLTVEQ